MGRALLRLLLVRVAADEDVADRGAMVICCCRSPVVLAAASPLTDKRQEVRRAPGRPRRCILHALGPLRGAHGLRGGHLTRGDASHEDRRGLFFRRRWCRRLLLRHAGQTHI